MAQDGVDGWTGVEDGRQGQRSGTRARDATESEIAAGAPFTALANPFPMQSATTMADQTFNANPTVFAPTKLTKRRTAKESLWLSGSDESDYESGDDIEPIDGDEVFGACHFVAFAALDILRMLQTSFGLSVTQSIVLYRSSSLP
jgi:hypothetical protein